VILLSQVEVEELLDLDALIDALAEAHRELSEGKASMPPRIAAFAERNGLLGAMPAYLPSAGLTCKLVSLFPENRDRHTHQALIAVFDQTNGTPIALIDGTYITATRTAAGSALATRLLAREDARVLAILGAGVQARTHADALRRVRPFEEVRVASRDRARAEAVAAEIGGTAASSFEEAVRGADVVAATTHATEPIVLRDWLAPGVHVNSVGANPAGRGEVDQAIVRDAAVVAVEYRESTLAPPPAGASEFREGAPGNVVELGELVAGTKQGRTSPEQITLYKSVGVAVQDAAAAALVLAAARQRSVGREIELEEST
jgi:alanine dehydrogenase